MKLRDKLLIPIGLALFGVLVVNLGAMRMAVSAWQTVDAQRQAGLTELSSLSDAELAFLEQVHAWKNVLLRGQSEDDYLAYHAEFRAGEDRVRRGLDAFIGATTDPTQRAQAERLLAQHRSLGVVYRQALQTFQTTPAPRAGQIADDEVRGVDRPLSAALVELRAQVRSRVQQDVARSAATGHWTAWGMLVGAVVLSLLITAMLLSVIHHLVVRPAQAASTLSRRLLQHDNEEDPAAARLLEDVPDDELGQLLEALNQLRRELTLERAQSAERLSQLDQARREAEAADDAKANFLAAITHELRTPLNGVVGSLQLLEDSELTAEQSDLMRAAAESSRRLATLVEDILDYTQVSGGDVELLDHPFDIERLLQSIVHHAQTLASSKAIELGFTAASGGPRTVRGDAERLRRVVAELVQNAIAATPAGRVEVLLTTGSSDGIARVRIDVVDTGPGIPDDLADQVFQPFAQVHQGLDRAREGAGLGLSMCRRVVAHLGGTLHHEPVTGGGTRFWLEFLLPQAIAPTEPSVASASTDAMPMPVQTPPTVLAVGREQSRAVRLLEQLNIPTLRAATLEDAMLHVAETPFEIAIVDIARIGVGSVEDLRGISDTVGHLTALVACARPEIRDRCLADGWDDVLIDEATPAELRTLLGRWLSTPLAQAS